MTKHKINTMVSEVVATLKRGGVIVYPTETIWGIGCDPFDQDAFNQLYKLKGRPKEKKCILVADTWARLKPLTAPVDAALLAQAQASWPGPTTWIFPAAKDAPKWLVQADNTLAIRVSPHPVCQAICRALDGPIVATSANPSGQPNLKSLNEVITCFKGKVDYIVPYDQGMSQKPSRIVDIRTGNILR